MPDDATMGPEQEGGQAEPEPVPEWTWLKERVEEEQEKRMARRRTEVRGTRLRPDEAEALDKMAQAAGVTPSTFIRLMCFGGRPDLEAERKVNERLLALIVRFAEAHADEPARVEEIQALREAAEQHYGSQRE